MAGRLSKYFRFHLFIHGFTRFILFEGESRDLDPMVIHIDMTRDKS